jgi:hypothetical protein
MDPLSITAAAIGLAVNVFSTALKAKDGFDKLCDAPQLLSDVADEVVLVHAALRQVEEALNDDSHVVARFALEEVFGVAVKGSYATLMCISKEFDQLMGRDDWKARVAVVWRASEMMTLLGRLDRKKASIALLVQLLNL